MKIGLKIMLLDRCAYKFSIDLLYKKITFIIWHVELLLLHIIISKFLAWYNHCTINSWSYKHMYITK